MKSILQVDVAGIPQKWINPLEAATIMCSEDISWTSGKIVTTLHGGVSKITGQISKLEVPAIVATKGIAKVNLLDMEPSLTRYNDKLFERDKHMCAYCGDVFSKKELTREHIHPVSKGGKDIWMNVVTACQSCNWRKADKSLDEVKMNLLYLPYIPNRYEDFLLQAGKRIIADQMEFLLSKVPKNSRLRH